MTNNLEIDFHDGVAHINIESDEHFQFWAHNNELFSIFQLIFYYFLV